MHLGDDLYSINNTGLETAEVLSREEEGLVLFVYKIVRERVP